MADTAAKNDHQTDTKNKNDEESQLVTLLQRERADFLNFRRRAEQERAEERERTRAELLIALLPLIDDMDRALAQVPDELTDHSWTKGVLLSERRILDFLTRSGVERFGRVGEQFDPEQHEAVFFEQRRDVASPRVEMIVRPGYRLGTRILRPAQVAVVGPTDTDAPETPIDVA